MAPQGLLIEVGARAERDHRSDHLPPFLIGHAHHKRVIDVSVLLQRFLYLFRIDLFPGGVNAHAAPTQQGQATVGLYLDPVARNGIALAVYSGEGFRRFLWVFVIPLGNRATASNEARLRCPGRQL